MRGRIAAAARTAAARSMAPREKAAAALAQEVFEEAAVWRDEDGPIILSTISVAARRVVPVALREAGIEESDENMVDAAAWLILEFVESIRRLSEDEIASFRAAR